MGRRSHDDVGRRGGRRGRHIIKPQEYKQQRTLGEKVVMSTHVVWIISLHAPNQDPWEGPSLPNSLFTFIAYNCLIFFVPCEDSADRNKPGFLWWWWIGGFWVLEFLGGKSGADGQTTENTNPFLFFSLLQTKLHSGTILSFVLRAR